MNKRISLVTLISVIIIVLALGIGIGYLITIKINNKQIIKDMSNEGIKTQEQTEKEEINEGSKNITINGINYKISYNSDFYKYDDTYPVVVNLYFNDKELRSINMPKQHGDIEIGEMINREYEVELHNISNEYILVVISNKSKLYDYEDAELCVINLDGEYIGSKHWQKGAESVFLKTNNKNLVRYEIYEDGFLIFKYFSDEKFVDMKYTILNNKIESKQDKFYSRNEVNTAGK